MLKLPYSSRNKLNYKTMGLFGGKSISENPFINQQEPEKEPEKEMEVKMETQRTKDDAQQELIEKFGLRKTLDFQLALQQGKIELAEEWLSYIVENKESFPQYLATWDNWLSDRQKELAEAKK